MSTFMEYPKISGPYHRHVEGPDRNKLIAGDWSSPDFEAVAALPWVWSEKVDGTNIRVGWDGHKVRFGGRTENSQIPAKLVQILNDTFHEELFEQVFQDTPVTLFGEGYGAGIQKGGGKYKSDGTAFVLFDVVVSGWWLLRSSVEEVAKSMGLQTVPVVLEGTVLEAIGVVCSGLLSTWSDTAEFTAEGLVGATKAGLLHRSGKRIQMKIKTIDFKAA